MHLLSSSSLQHDAKKQSRSSHERLPNQLDLDAFSSARPPCPSKIESFDHDEDENDDEIDAIKAACLGRGGLCGCCWCCARHHPCARYVLAFVRFLAMRGADMSVFRLSTCRFCCSPQIQTIGFLIFLLALIVAFIYIVLSTGDDAPRQAQSVLLEVQEIMQWNANFGCESNVSLTSRRSRLKKNSSQ